MFFFFNDTATTEIYTLSLHDALPIYADGHQDDHHGVDHGAGDPTFQALGLLLEVGEALQDHLQRAARSEEHTSELQSRQYLVCRLLLEKKKTKRHTSY